MATIRHNEVMGQKLRCGSQLVDIYVKQHKEKARREALERGLPYLMHLGTTEWYALEKQRWLVIENKAEEEREREVEKVQMQVMKDLAGLPRFTSECLDYLIVLLPCLYFHVRG